jgi:hypothetical protein
MEESRWPARVLSEIGSARAAILANYLALWRQDTVTSMDEQTEPPAPGAGDGQPAPTPPRPGYRDRKPQ